MPTLKVTDTEISLSDDDHTSTIRWDEITRFTITMPEYHWTLFAKDGPRIILTPDISMDESDEFTELMGDKLSGWDGEPSERYDNVCVNDDIEPGEYLIWSQ